MAITKSQRIFRLLSFLLLAICLLQLSGLVLGVLMYVSYGADFKLNTFAGTYTFINIGYSENGVMIPQMTINVASIVTIIPYTLIVVFVAWQGSRLLRQLSQGGTPFSTAFALKFQRMGLLLILADILHPLIYSLILSLMIPDGYHFQYGVSAVFFIGAMMSGLAEILKYGVELQKLADETV